MNVSHPDVSYSSIVKIGEDINKLEKQNGKEYLKLHRGVMDVTTIDLKKFYDKLYKADLNSKFVQHYSPNDGIPSLINTVNTMLGIPKHKTLITAGGMASLDLVINSLGDKNFYIPYFHWGSWNKLLKIHDKKIFTYDEFNLDSFRPNSGVVMFCFPSNPTGYQPRNETIESFLKYAKEKDITVILDLPYYHLFNEFDSGISKWLTDNLILVSSFSKSIGLSGFRIGYVSTSSDELYDALRIRSLYKYNSISVVPQVIINYLLEEHYAQPSKSAIREYQQKTVDNITKNIEFLKGANLLMDDYPSTPTGPFVITKLSYDNLLEMNISSVPLSKFNLDGSHGRFTRISVSVEHQKMVDFLSNI
jgi:aspartate/methionine/tyrosine aminotransferase